MPVQAGRMGFYSALKEGTYSKTGCQVWTQMSIGIARVPPSPTSLFESGGCGIALPRVPMMFSGESYLTVDMCLVQTVIPAPHLRPKRLSISHCLYREELTISYWNHRCHKSRIGPECRHKWFQLTRVRNCVVYNQRTSGAQCAIELRP